jgi:NAD(P)-dependent dehydrogenase (short-subunit alcohol dehydrogenase family)
MLIDKADLSRAALQGKIAVVTGAGQGIGRDTVRILARLGAAVVIAEMSDAGCETEQLIHSDGGRVLFVKTDVADPQSMEHLRQRVCDTFGAVDILVNNAEATEVKTVLEHSVEEWDRVFAVNLRGAFLGIKAFLPAMLQRHEGVIVTMESAEGMPYMSAYFASKVGLRSLAQSLDAEVEAHSGVCVYCFGAGMVDTPGMRAALKRLAPHYNMSEDEFIRQSASGGQLISAELCATGLVGTILHAKEFHGQETGYVAGLSKLGLNPRGERWETEVKPGNAETPVVAHERTGDGDASSLIRQAITLNRKMEDIVRANIKEYDELSMFQRPVMRRMFQQGAGMKVEDWLASAEDMTARLQRLDANGQGEIQEVTSHLAAYMAQLKRMAEFITKQESDARGWMKDPAKLELALAALRERKETAQELERVLATISSNGPAGKAVVEKVETTG